MYYHVYDDNDTLKSVMLGTWFLPEYFDTIKDSNVREPLKQLAHETHEDLDAFSNTLKQHGVQVVRPTSPQGYYLKDKAVLPALNVRDTMRVVDNKLYKLLSKTIEHDQCIEDVLPDFIDLTDILKDSNNLCKDLPLYSKQHYELLAGADWPSFDDFCSGTTCKDTDITDEIEQFRDSFTYDTLGSPQGPNILLHNNEVIVDHHEYVDFVDVLQNHIKTNKLWKSINTRAGHTDGCFNTLNSNTVIGIDTMLETFFPTYNKIKVTWDNYQNTIEYFKRHKQSVGGRWWVPGQEHNLKFTAYVEKYLTHLVGLVEETQFDVNVLSLDSKTVFVTGTNAKKLKVFNIDTIPIRWRHRWFHDGGLHCITLDLHRQ